jgi:hypothetical protein
MKQSFSFVQTWQSIRDQLHDYPVWGVDMAMHGISAFFVGFLIRNCGRMLLFALLSVACGVFVLDKLQIVIVDFAYAKALIGVSGGYGVDDMIKLGMHWMRMNQVASLGMMSGFVLGWKLGK